MASTTVQSEEQLRDIIKAPPSTVTAKIRSGPLRVLASEFLLAARLGVISTPGTDGSLRTWAVGGEAGFVTQDATDASLIVPLADSAAPSGWFANTSDSDEASGSLDDDLGGDRTAGFAGLLLMVPGVKYTLRVNGSAALRNGGDFLVVTPNQSYAHCAKAYIRSGLWNANAVTPVGLDQTQLSDGPARELDDVAVEFIEASPFAALGTSLVGSDADVSPRGDPAGFVQVVDRDRLFIADRPGNRIADSLRNIIANPKASLLFVIPGDPRVLEVSGEAEVTTDPELCAAAEINAKIPKLGVAIKVQQAHLRNESAMASSGAWDPATHASESDLATIGAMVADPNGTKSMAKRAMSGAADRAVGVDYKRNLY